MNNKSLSIRICPDGLSFCVYSHGEDDSLDYFVYPMQPTISLAANLKEALLTTPMLKEEYQRVNVLVATPHFTLVPSPEFDQDFLKDIFLLNFPKEEATHVSFNMLRRSDITIVFGLNRNVHQLISDDFPRARFYASASTLIEFFAEKSLTGEGQNVFAYLHGRELTLYAFNQGKLLFANSYASRHSSDDLYYIMQVWKQLGMDQLGDQLQLVCDKDTALTDKRLEELTAHARKYLKRVTVINPQEDFQSKITQGHPEIPYDLQTILVCGF